MVLLSNPTHYPSKHQSVPSVAISMAASGRNYLAYPKAKTSIRAKVTIPSLLLLLLLLLLLKMQASLYLLPLLATFAPTSSIPAKAPEKRDQCGEFSTLSDGGYTLGSDLWGESLGTGSQCSSINGLNDGSLAWSTTWSWSGDNANVKSYTNVVSSNTYCGQISSISSLPTSWDWRYDPPWNIRFQACH